jgi:hypothetical protein
MWRANPTSFIPAQAGIQINGAGVRHLNPWVPAFAGTDGG